MGGVFVSLYPLNGPIHSRVGCPQSANAAFGHCCCFFKTLGFPPWEQSLQCTYSSGYTVLPPSHRRLSVWESSQLNQRLNHCVWTRPANKDNLSALSSLPLLASFLRQRLQQLWEGIQCPDLPYICISCYHVGEQGDTGIHLCPRCGREAPTCPTTLTFSR